MQTIISRLLIDERRLESPSVHNNGISKCQPNVLHVACRLRLPLQAIRAIAHTFPRSVTQVDNRLQTPLHIAAEQECLPEVVDFLVRAYPGATSIQDVNGKTPLHLICEQSDVGRKHAVAGQCGGFGRTAKGPSKRRLIKRLCKVAPNAVNIVDFEGASALELAICSNADLKIVNVLQRAAIKARTRRPSRPRMEHSTWLYSRRMNRST